jgi:hypothetical protein
MSALDRFLASRRRTRFDERLDARLRELGLLPADQQRWGLDPSQRPLSYDEIEEG